MKIYLSKKVIDPFIGSDTTAVACCDLGRHYIGYELNKEYYKVAEERIQNETGQI